MCPRAARPAVALAPLRSGDGLGRSLGRLYLFIALRNMPRRTPSDGADRAKGWRLVAEYSGLAVAIPIATVLGYAAGSWLDTQLGTGYWAVVGLILGIISGFYQLIRKALRDAEGR